jgi:preprotein translocase subunit SecB
MIKSENAAGFKFVKYRIPKFSFEETKINNPEFDMSFNPSGIYNENTGIYELTLNFESREKESKNLVIEVCGVAEFKFDKPYKFNELPPHFFVSVAPIFFPYLRAFISTLTLQANTNVLVLGLINFTTMAEPLKANTKIVNQ